MKSIRLNKQIRTQIVNNIRDAYVKENKEPESTDDRSTKLKEVLLKHYKHIHRDIIEYYNNNPDKQKYINTTSYVGFRDANNNHWLEFNLNEGETVYLPSPESSGVFIDLANPDAKIPASIKKVLERNKSLSKTLRKEREARSKYSSDLSRYLQGVRQVIDGVNTSKQLMEVWPEVEKFLPQGVTNPSKINLPAVNTQSLNSKLGV